MIEKNKKIDLLAFQRGLNEQFLQVLEDKKKKKSENEDVSSDLGLIDSVDEYQFLFPLKELKNISSDNKVETIPLTKSWILGFNQIYGEVYTILNFKKIINYLLFNQLDDDNSTINKDSNIVYIKSYNESKFALSINKLELKYTTSLVLLYSCELLNENYIWKKINKIDSNVDIQNITKKQLEVLENLVVENKHYNGNILFNDKELLAEKKLLWLLVSNVYYDKDNNNLVFMVDINKLTKLLNTISPF